MWRNGALAMGDCGCSIQLPHDKRNDLGIATHPAELSFSLCRHRQRVLERWRSNKIREDGCELAGSAPKRRKMGGPEVAMNLLLTLLASSCEDDADEDGSRITTNDTTEGATPEAAMISPGNTADGSADAILPHTFVAASDASAANESDTSGLFSREESANTSGTPSPDGMDLRPARTAKGPGLLSSEGSAVSSRISMDMPIIQKGEVASAPDTSTQVVIDDAEEEAEHADGEEHVATEKESERELGKAMEDHQQRPPGASRRLSRKSTISTCPKPEPAEETQPGPSPVDSQQQSIQLAGAPPTVSSVPDTPAWVRNSVIWILRRSALCASHDSSGAEAGDCAETSEHANSSGDFIITCEKLRTLLAQPDVLASFMARGFGEIMTKLLDGVAVESGEVSVGILMDKVLRDHVPGGVLVPLVGWFRDASCEESMAMPHILAQFQAYLKRKRYTANTRELYLNIVQEVFTLDRKSPEDVACPSYIEAETMTMEGARSKNLHRAALKRFSDFWQSSSPAVRTGDDAPLLRARKIQVKKRRARAEDGKTSVKDSAMLEACGVPKDWRLHEVREKAKALLCSSPRGRFYLKPFASKQTDHQKDEPVELIDSEEENDKVEATPPKRTRTPMQELETQQKEDRPRICDSTSVPKADHTPLATHVQPLLELAGPATDGERKSDRDKMLLSHVLASFDRYLAATREAGTDLECDVYSTQIFKLFCRVGRSFDGLASQRFMTHVSSCAENKQSHGLWYAALQAFVAFWESVGGYHCEFEQCTDKLTSMLVVKPRLVDVPLACGYNSHMNTGCQRARQLCDTCGTVLQCSLHDEHSDTDCREIFWAKHTPAGTLARTMRCFSRGGAGRRL